MPTKDRVSRQQLTKERGLQQIARVPPYRPGDIVVRLRRETHSLVCNHDCDCESLQRVRSLTASITEAEGPLVWRVHFSDGRCVVADAVRPATDEELAFAKRRGIR